MLEAKLTAYEKRAEDLHKRVEDLKTLASLLLGVSFLYTIVLGISTYLGVHDATTRAKDFVRDLEKMKSDATQGARENAERLEKLASEARQESREAVRDTRNETKMAVDEISKQLPLFRHMSDHMNAITGELLQLLPFSEVEWSRYATLTPADKMKIGYYENTVATFEFIDLAPFRHDASEIYRGLGVFYGMKYAGETREKRQLEEDLERARFYLDCARREDTRNIGALNDRGFLALFVDPLKDLSNARTFFERSLQVDPNQQKAKFYLAIVEHKQGKYGASEKLLTEALALDRWEARKPFPRYRQALLYNRACARARLGSNESDPSRQTHLFRSAFKDLEEVFPAGQAYEQSPRGEAAHKRRKQDFENDIKAGGDLYALTATEAFEEETKNLRDRILSF